MSFQTLLPEDHPMHVAWNAYLETEDFKNTERWAKQDAKYLMGSMWAVFSAGFKYGRNMLVRGRDDKSASDKEIVDITVICPGSAGDYHRQATAQTHEIDESGCLSITYSLNRERKFVCFGAGTWSRFEIKPAEVPK